METRLAPASYSFGQTDNDLSLNYATGQNDTIDLRKTGANQVQVTLGADVWQNAGTTAVPGVSGDGQNTLTIDTTKFTGAIHFDFTTAENPDGSPANTLTFTIHGIGSNGSHPTVQSGGGNTNILFTDGTSDFAPVPNQNWSPAFSTAGDVAVNAPISTSNANGIQIDASNITVNDPISTEGINNEEPGVGTAGISLNASNTLYLNALVHTGDIGTASNPMSFPGDAGYYSQVHSGSIAVSANSLVGDASGQLLTGSVYTADADPSIPIYGADSGSLYIHGSSADGLMRGELRMAAADALQTGDVLSAGLGGHTGSLSIYSDGNVSSDGASGKLSMYIGNGTEVYILEPTGANIYGPITFGTGQGELALEKQGGGNAFISSANAIGINFITGSPKSGQTIDIQTTGGNSIFTEGLLGNVQGNTLDGDSVRLDAGSGALTMMFNSNYPDLFGNLTLVADQISMIGDFKGNPAAPSPLVGTGALVLEPGTRSRDIQIGGTAVPTSALNLNANNLGVIASGFSSITIGRPDATGTVTIAGNTSFSAPTTIDGGVFTDAGGSSVTTTGTNGLTLNALTGAIGSSIAPVGVAFGGKLNLSTVAGGDAGVIFASTAQALALNGNTFLSTSTDPTLVSLTTTSGGITAASTGVNSQAVSVAGNLLLLGTATVDDAGNHTIYRLGSDGKLNDTGVVGIAVSTIDGTVWSVDASQNVYYWDIPNNRWVPAPKGIRSGGSTFFLGTATVDSSGDHKIYRFDANGQLSWTNAVATALGTADGTAWFVNAANSVSSWNAFNSSWVQAPKQLVLGGSVFFLGTAADSSGDYTIYSFANGKLISTNGQGVNLGIAESTLWAVNAANNVSHYDATSNAWVAAQPNAVTAGGSVFFLGTATVDSAGEHSVYRFDSTGQLGSTNGIAVDLGAEEGTVWTANAFHDVRYWDGANNVWGPARSSVVGPDGSVFFVGTNILDAYGNSEAYRFGTDGQLSDTGGSGMSLEVQSGNVLLVQDFFSFGTFSYEAVTFYWGSNGTWVLAEGSGVNPVQGNVYYNYATPNPIDVASESHAWFPSGGNSSVFGGVKVGTGGTAIIQGKVTAPVTDNGGTVDIAPGALATGDLAILTGNSVIDGILDGPVTVSGGGSLQGSGDITGNLATQANVISPGSLAIILPGDSPGELTVGGLSLDSSGEIQEKIYGPLADTTYSQIAVKGDASLGGATLKVDLGGYQPAAGQQFVIIDNQGANPIHGTFLNPPEGGLLTVGSTAFRISYKGGDGNDVTLTSIAPTVTGVSSTTANGGYGVGSSIAISVGFSAPVVVTGTPQLALNSGGTATYSSGSGTSSLTFTYTVAAGQSANPLDEASVNALTLNGGTIKDGAGDAANLELPAPDTAGALGVNKAIVIDTVAPTVVSFNVLFGKESYNLIGSTRFDLPWAITGIQVVFSKPIASGDANSLTGLSAASFSGLGTKTLTWNFNAITLGKFATTLQGSGGDALKDVAGNPLTGGAGFAQNFNVLEGDVNDDGVVDAADLVTVYRATRQPYNIFDDINGDGAVNMADVSLVRQLIGNKLS